MKNSGHTISSMDDLLNLPDIGGIVQELRDENVVASGNGKTMEDKQYTSNHLWQLFLNCGHPENLQYQPNVHQRHHQCCPACLPSI